MKSELKIMPSLAQLDALCSSGYAIALHIRYTTPKFLFQTYDKEWMKTYSEKGLVLKDPTVMWGFGNTGIARWSDLTELDEAGVLNMAKEYGLKHGFTFAIASGESKSITSFARGDREFTNAEIDEISGIVQELHDYTANIEKISPEEVEQLKNLSVDFTHG
ncbi:MAG: transcriptional regulator [Marinosulfonomonas sp.]|nr:MAG: transcriptional regulator [Marinosulfonomonas sp.]